ncbi:hypothetical protein B0H14DRAFT_2594057 [Mycena olivaceomarginata]|nr:hypothetical protein B0H14DRAFT_2594057 [Mycena olivaceomarginata]
MVSLVTYIIMSQSTNNGAPKPDRKVYHMIVDQLKILDHGDGKPWNPPIPSLPQRRYSPMTPKRPRNAAADAAFNNFGTRSSPSPPKRELNHVRYEFVRSSGIKLPVSDSEDDGEESDTGSLPGLQSVSNSEDEGSADDSDGDSDSAPPVASTSTSRAGPEARWAEDRAKGARPKIASYFRIETTVEMAERMEREARESLA